MNQESYHTPPPAQAPRIELDIVRDCSDLMGEFPSNVELKFIYWKHEYPGDAVDFEAQANRLARHCLQADVIAQEVGSTAHANSNDAHREFHIINDIVSGEVVHNTFDEYFGDLPSTTLLASCLELTTAMKHLGRTKPPKFIAVDVLENIDAGTLNIDAAIEAGVLDWAVASAAIKRRREAVTIRQLYDESHQLAQDGAQHQIAVVYGTGHSLLSVATRVLGAKTSRVFVDKPTLLVVQQLERSLRYRQAADILPEIEAAEVADKIGFLIQSLAERLDLDVAEIGPDDTTALELYSKLGLLFLQATKGLLSKADYETFNSDLLTVERFLPYGKKIPLFKRQGVKQAAKRIIELGDKLLGPDKSV